MKITGGQNKKKMNANSVNYQKTGGVYSNVQLTTALGMTLFNNLLVVWLSEVKDFQGFEMTLLIGVTPIVVLPFLILWSRYLDKSGKLVHTLMWIQIISALLMLGMVLVNDYKIFFFLNFLRNVAILPLIGIKDQYLTTLVEQGKLEFGKIRMFGTIGFGVSGILGAILIRFFGVTTCILIAVLLTLLPAITIRKLPELTDDASIKRNETNIKEALKDVLGNKDFMELLIISSAVLGVITSACNYGMQRTLLSLDCPTEYIGLMPFILVITEVIFLRVTDKIHIKEMTVYVLSLLICMIRWGGLAFSHSYILILVLCLGHGIVGGIFLPVQNRKVLRVIKPEYQATAYLIMSTVTITIVPSIINLICESLVVIMGESVIGIV